MIRLYHAIVYYGMLLAFGATGLALHAFALSAAWLPRSERRERLFRRLIRRSFASLVAGLNATRTVTIRYRGFDVAAHDGLVVAANHPGLLDAVYLLARVPEAVCIFKGSIRRNPILGAARSAGYLANDGGLSLVREASAKVAAGAALVVFPEGTRTPDGGPLGTFKPGFAAIARRAGVPIQLVRIACDSNLLTKQRAWWKLPRLPARVIVEAGPRLAPEAGKSTAALVEEAETWFRATAAERPASRTRALEYSASVPTLTAS